MQSTVVLANTTQLALLNQKLEKLIFLLFTVEKYHPGEE